jgi:hypothetical protein
MHDRSDTVNSHESASLNFAAPHLEGAWSGVVGAPVRPDG